MREADTAESRASRLGGRKLAPKHKERGYSRALEDYLIAISRIAQWMGRMAKVCKFISRINSAG
jgi:hypothetical protein